MTGEGRVVTNFSTELTSVEEQQDSGLGGRGRDVDGLRLEIAAQHGKAVVVVPLQLTVLHRGIVVLLQSMDG